MNTKLQIQTVGICYVMVIDSLSYTLMWCVCVPTIMICKSGLLSIRGGLWVAVGMYRRETYCDILKKEIVYFIKRERERDVHCVCLCEFEF